MTNVGPTASQLRARALAAQQPAVKVQDSLSQLVGRLVVGFDCTSNPLASDEFMHCALLLDDGTTVYLEVTNAEGVAVTWCSE